MNHDPFLWLEEVEEKESFAWSQAETKRTRDFFSKRANFASDKNKIQTILDSDEKLPTGILFNGYFYNFWRDKKTPKGIWRRCLHSQIKENTWETLIDYEKLGENFTHKYVDFCESHPRRALVSYSHGGKDAAIIREFDLEKKEFVPGGFEIPEGKNGACWFGRDKLFISSGELTKSGYPRQLFILNRDQSFEKKTKIYEVPEDHISIWPFDINVNGKVEQMIYHGVSFFQVKTLWYKNNKIIEIPAPAESYCIGMDDLGFIFLLKEDWNKFKAQSLVRFNFADILDNKNEPSLLMAPKDGFYVQGAYILNGKIFIEALHNVNSVIFEIKNKEWIRVTPESVNSYSFFAFDKIKNIFWCVENSFLKPSTISNVSLDNYNLNHVMSGPSTFDSSKYKVEQFFATSNDGTKIPYFVIGPKNRDTNKKYPSILYGYGGFDVSLTPSYMQLLGPLWLEKGGIYILANIRGGGEFGPQWHKSVQKMNRKKCYEDFGSVAKDVYRGGISSSEKLSIYGGSNGGLLVGATMALYPNLCKAVVCAVPLLDMTRYHKLLAGASWAEEYGTVEDSDQMKNYILSYSPYQNISSNMKYPSVLFETSTYDDRVHPGHARKMMAKMKELNCDVWLNEEKEGGHGAQVANEKLAYNKAIFYHFLYEKLDL